MKKYVRTDDGRIIDTTKERETNLCNQRAWCPKKGHVVYENDIIKQADTIGELCDKFLVIETSGEIVIRTSWKNFGAAKDWFKNHCELFPSNQYELYGSIWVGVDLHAVAKLNDKGELELL